jgi:hypothetical protein
MVDQGNKGTEVRAVRIPRNIGTILENEAKDQRVTVNSLINIVLKKNIEFDRCGQDWFCFFTSGYL